MDNEVPSQQFANSSSVQNASGVTSQAQTQSAASVDTVQLLTATQTASNALNNALEALTTANNTESKVAHQQKEVIRQRKRVDELADKVDDSNTKVNNIVGAVVIALLIVLISAVLFEIQFMQSTKAANDQMSQFISQSLKANK